MSFIVVLIIIFGVAVGFLSWFVIRIVAAPHQTKAIEEQLKQGHISSAIRGAKALVAKDPHNGEAHWLLGLGYLSDNKPELALMELKQVGQLGEYGPGFTEAEYRRQIAALYERFNQTEEALKERILLTKLEPKSAINYYEAGRLFEDRGNTDIAINYMQKAIELDARIAPAHHQLGLIYYRTKRPVEAKNEFELALRGNPDDFEAFFYLGKILKDLKDYTGALLSFEKATRSSAYKGRALVERGGCYMSEGSIDKAVPELERAVKCIKDESSSEALYGRYFLAMCYEKQRNLDKAIEQWEKIYAKKPNFRDVAEKLSEYQEYRTDDRMKDFLTCGHDEFMELCKAIVQGPLGLSIRTTTEISNGVDIIAIPNDSEKWLGAKKMPRLVRFLRVSDMLSDSAVRALIDQMQTLGMIRGAIVTSTTFLRSAYEFAENRSVELYGKDQLQEMLLKTQGIASGKK